MTLPQLLGALQSWQQWTATIWHVCSAHLCPPLHKPLHSSPSGWSPHVPAQDGGAPREEEEHVSPLSAVLPVTPCLGRQAGCSLWARVPNLVGGRAHTQTLRVGGRERGTARHATFLLHLITAMAPHNEQDCLHHQSHDTPKQPSQSTLQSCTKEGVSHRVSSIMHNRRNVLALSPPQ